MKGRPKGSKDGKQNKIKRICQKCGKEFWIWPYKIKEGKYCSRKCFDERSPKIRKICPICKKLFKVYSYIVKNNGGKYCSIQCVGKTRMGKTLSLQWKRNISKGKKGKKLSKTHIENLKKVRKGLLAGSKHPNWRGGISSEQDRVRRMLKYTNWRKKVFKRDHYTCQVCARIGGNLHAHHKKSFSKFPKLRFKVSNGLTLCKKCHDKIHFKKHIITK